MGMKSIEERAWEKYPEVIKHHNLARIDINEEKRKMYIEIATEQKEIDIEKAASWFGDYLTELRDSVNWFYGSSKMKSGKDRFMEAMKK